MSLGVSCAFANLIGESSLANVTVRIDVAMPLHLSGADCELFLNELSLSSNQSLRILQVSALERTDRPIGKSTHGAGQVFSSVSEAIRWRPRLVPKGLDLVHVLDGAGEADHLPRGLFLGTAIHWISQIAFDR